MKLSNQVESLLKLQEWKKEEYEKINKSLY